MTLTEALVKIQELEKELAEFRELEDFLLQHLKLWKDEGVPAPLNELQSIAAWLRESHDVEAMQDKMMNRMLLLMDAAERLHKKGPAAEVAAGIFDNRPELKCAP